jgi:hypothetical protein
MPSFSNAHPMKRAHAKTNLRLMTVAGRLTSARESVVGESEAGRGYSACCGACIISERWAGWSPKLTASPGLDFLPRCPHKFQPDGGHRRPAAPKRAPRAERRRLAGFGRPVHTRLLGRS